jgi:hypothetical protein
MKTTTTKALVWAPIHATNTERTKVKAQLADDCKNGIAHFSLTCDIYEKNKRGQWEDVGGGCAHEHILKAFKDSPDLPHLAQLARLHLSDQNGVPMHGPENAFYWFAGMFADGLGEQYHGGSGRDGKSKEDCARIFAEHIRATPEQFAEIVKLCPWVPRTVESRSQRPYCLARKQAARAGHFPQRSHPPIMGTAHAREDCRD